MALKVKRIKIIGVYLPPELVIDQTHPSAMQGNPVKDRSCTRSCNLHSNQGLQPQKPLLPTGDGKAKQTGGSQNTC